MPTIITTNYDDKALVERMTLRLPGQHNGRGNYRPSDGNVQGDCFNRSELAAEIGGYYAENTRKEKIHS